MERRWLKPAGFVLAAILFVYAIVYVDLINRAHASYLEGEKYMEWYRNPSKKSTDLDAAYNKQKAVLDKDKASGVLSDDEYASRLASIDFEKKFQLSESSLKYAYQWYKDTYELFSPPESKWVRAAREKAPEALSLWKEELRTKKIPFDDHMFE
jgi:hypothetical protein